MVLIYLIFYKLPIFCLHLVILNAALAEGGEGDRNTGTADRDEDTASSGVDVNSEVDYVRGVKGLEASASDSAI
jgi:hypothetical protein